jgi:hypothetical protein
VLAAETTYRVSFRPHLQVQTARRVPSPIFAVALIGIKRLRIVELSDDVTAVDEDAREQIVRSAIMEHYREQAGQVPCFGEITGSMEGRAKADLVVVVDER